MKKLFLNEFFKIFEACMTYNNHTDYGLTNLEKIFAKIIKMSFNNNIISMHYSKKNFTSLPKISI